MLDELIENLNTIDTEIQTKILPENIKKGVVIFGVEGTYEGSVAEDDTTTE